MFVNGTIAAIMIPTSLNRKIGDMSNTVTILDCTIRAVGGPTHDIETVLV